ncbi:MAG TPA: gliding motility-associated C-terminal domain-containing protein, partial [Puia sp.]|nr:gliding motility-associated C-terminal domain-containing protein [Puia sp.]
WSPADGLSNPDIRNPIAILPEGSTTYTLKATTDGGCDAIASITIKSYGVADIFVPSAFSPNGDGHNDVLRALPVGIREFKYFAVFSRWGQRVFYTANASKGWDGLINGNVQELGTYVWMAGGIDYAGNWVQRKGTVILVR